MKEICYAVSPTKHYRQVNDKYFVTIYNNELYKYTDFDAFVENISQYENHLFEYTAYTKEQFNKKKKELPVIFQRPRYSTNYYYIDQADESYKVDQVQFITLDYDDNATRDFVEDKLNEYNYYSYYSISHGIKEGQRFRIILEIEAPITWTEYTDAKEGLMKYFGFGYKIDSVSFSDGVIYLPMLYKNTVDNELYNSNIRYPQPKRNNGKPFELNTLVQQLIIEKEIQTKTRGRIKEQEKYTHLINDKSPDCYNSDRQLPFIEKARHKLETMEDGNKFPSIVSAVGTLCNIGLSTDKIADIIAEYIEPHFEHQMPYWEKLIDKWHKPAIPHFNRYETRDHNGEPFIFDNLKKVYLDGDREYKQRPRNNNRKIEELINSDILAKYIYSKVEDLKKTKRIYDFVKLIELKSTGEKIKLGKYRQRIEKGVRLTSKDWRAVGFKIFEFLKLLPKKTNKIKLLLDEKNGVNNRQNMTDSLFNVDVSDVRLLFNHHGRTDIENADIKVLLCLKELIWYRYYRPKMKGSSPEHYFSLKKKTKDLLKENKKSKENKQLKK